MMPCVVSWYVSCVMSWYGFLSIHFFVSCLYMPAAPEIPFETKWIECHPDREFLDLVKCMACSKTSFYRIAFLNVCTRARSTYRSSIPLGWTLLCVFVFVCVCVRVWVLVSICLACAGFYFCFCENTRRTGASTDNPCSVTWSRARPWAPFWFFQRKQQLC